MKFTGRKNFAEVRKIRFARDTFDMSHTHQMAGDWGWLYPVFYEEASPTDYWKLNQSLVAKMMPTIAPLQHEINAFVHYYFVPYRLIHNQWEDFITGGPDGQNASTLPQWDPSDSDKTPGSLWDHFGFPLTECTGVRPINYPLRAYNFVWSEYYRDENLTSEVPYPYEANIYSSGAAATYRLCQRAWEKDYVTASLPWQQRGIAPSLPITGTTFAEWVGADIVQAVAGTFNAAFKGGSVDPVIVTGDNTAAGTQARENALAFLNSNTVDFADASTFDVADLRAAIQIQRWMERNARGGARYTEVLEQHFNDAPEDSRLQRPEYIGGYRCPISIVEVLQTSEDGTTPQGNRAGIGSAYSSGHVGTYKVKEYGIIIGLLSIMPRTMYTQGVNRQWLRRTRYDFLWPEFVNLSEQAVLKGELFASDTEATNVETFGYQGRYDELRQRANRAVGLMRQSTSGLIYWNLSRKFATAPALNQQFVTVETQDLKDRVFQYPNEPGFIITLGNIATVDRALPTVAEPGLMDH